MYCPSNSDGSFATMVEYSLYTFHQSLVCNEKLNLKPPIEDIVFEEQLGVMCQIPFNSQEDSLVKQTCAKQSVVMPDYGLILAYSMFGQSSEVQQLPVCPMFDLVQLLTPCAQYSSTTTLTNAQPASVANSSNQKVTKKDQEIHKFVMLTRIVANGLRLVDRLWSDHTSNDDLEDVSLHKLSFWRYTGEKETYVTNICRMFQKSTS